MRVARFVLSFLLLLSSSPCLNSQQSVATPERDPQAAAILQQSIVAFAKTSPTDSSANGTVTIVEGSTTQSGSIQILTRGAAQTMETLNLPGGQRSVTYSNGDAKEVIGSQATIPRLELIVTDQSADFPLPLLLWALNNSDEAFLYIGQETLNGTSTQHIQVWNTFASKPRLGKLAPFSARDIWFDTSSSLPLKIAFSRRAGGGAVPAIPVEVLFSNYTNVGGVLYPFQINKSYNGTPWQTITIQNVSFNTGLTDAQFQVN